MALDFDRVTTTGLTKMYGLTRALAGVDVCFEAGKVTVVEGPNGSGKSTLLSIVAQLTRPTKGRVRYGNISERVARREIRQHLGVLGHASMLYPDLTGRENLALYARLYGLPGAARIDALATRFELGAFFERPTRTYSRGQLQRVALARAVLHEPRLLLLDEPSTGLDVKAVERLVTAVEAERERGAICVLITHDPALRDRIADAHVRLDRGRLAKEPEQ